MTPERWKKIEDIFQEALDCPTAERRKFIAEKADGDEDLRREVEKLVARIETDENFLESPVWTDSLLLQSNFKREIASSLEEIAPSGAYEMLIGKQIGVYRLAQELGRGGMGVVFLAERADGEFYQKVAIKLIKRGMDTDFIVKRFRHERQILASLNHPNIARLLDGGTTDDDLPYFVMEFIEGAPFFKYCDAKNLNLRRKLELFLQVCAAISYAHKRKIIHRDIKPGNILVTEEGTPKLLDFGIAKILDPDLIHESIAPTATAMRLMTPEYASPEQVTGDEITEASDQYSLGVLLYELITGIRPYKFPSRAPHEIARVICEAEPSQPSAERTNIVMAQDTSLLNNESFQKLDSIVLKALRKNPAERYPSVEEFAAGIERFLKREIVRTQSSEKENTQISGLLSSEKALDTQNSAKTTQEGLKHKSTEKPQPPKALLPRWRGIKQGIFIIILSVLSVPIFLLLTVAAIIPPPIVTAIFIAFFLSGFVRILYALLFESGNKESASQTPETLKTVEPETKFITPAARETASKSFSADQNREESEKSIAVLPFQTLKKGQAENSESDAFLGIGLADALITKLSNVQRLVVRPTNSILRFDLSEVDLSDVGRELNVSYILSGNILRAGERIRISVQLLNVAAQSTVWAERFEENFDDVLELEDSISRKVAESLIPQLTVGEIKELARRGTDNLEAYEAYLRGRFHFNTFTDEGFRQAIRFYQEAIELDPDYALAYAGIADYYNWLGMMNMLPAREFYAPAKEAALRAITLDDKSSEAYSALGLTRLYGEYDWQQSEKAFQRALEINPHNSVAHNWYSQNLYTQNRVEDGIKHNRRALELDPSSFQHLNSLAWGLYFARRIDEALKVADRISEKFPNSGYSYFARTCFLSLAGKTEEALKASQKMLELSDDNLFIYGRAQAFAAAGKRQEAIKILESAKNYISHYHTAVIHCFLKDKEKAFVHLERSLAAHEGMLIWAKIEPSLDVLRDDPRYQSLLEKMKTATPPVGGADKLPKASKKTPPQAETIVQPTAEKKNPLPKFLKYALAAIGVILLALLVYNIFTHTTLDFTTGQPPARK